MSEWVESPLTDLANIVSGGTPSRDVPAYWGGEIPWATPTDITACQTNYLEQTQDSISKQGLLSSSAKLLPAGSILLTSRASIGLAKIARVPVSTNQGFKSLIPKQGIDGTFLFYQTQRLRGSFERFAAGSTFLEINKKDTERILLPHPTDPVEQEKIATILTGIDTAIEKTEALIAKYQQIKAGLMHDLFTRGVLPNGQLRPPREQSPELYQESAIGWIPREWDTHTFPAIASIQHGQPFPSEDYSESGVLLLRPGNLHKSGLVIFDEAHTTRLPLKWLGICRHLIIVKRDILMNLTAQSLDDQFLGRVCMALSCEPSLLNQRIGRITPLGVGRDFLYWQLRSHIFREQIDRTTQGTKVQHLYNRDIERVVLAVPQLSDEQIRISDILWSASEKISSAERDLGKLSKQKLGLMQDLLTGKVPVKIEESEVVGG